MKKLDILIVEDEILIAELISDYLSEIGHRVLGIAVSYQEAAKEFNLRRPDLILMDIRLYGDKSGIDFANYVLSLDYKAPIIYLSSQYDQRTMKVALETHPYGYLTKPIRKETLWTTIQSAYHHYQSTKQKEYSIDIFDGRANRKFNIDDIVYIRANHIYLEFFIKDGQTITVRNTIKQLLNELPEEIMLQCHRSYIINKNHIESWNTNSIQLSNSDVIPISRYRKISLD